MLYGDCGNSNLNFKERTKLWHESRLVTSTSTSASLSTTRSPSPLLFNHLFFFFFFSKLTACCIWHTFESSCRQDGLPFAVFPFPGYAWLPAQQLKVSFKSPKRNHDAQLLSVTVTGGLQDGQTDRRTDGRTEGRVLHKWTNLYEIKLSSQLIQGYRFSAVLCVLARKLLENCGIWEEEKNNLFFLFAYNEYIGILIF